MTFYNNVPLTDQTRRGYPGYAVIFGAVVMVIGLWLLYSPVVLAFHQERATAHVSSVDSETDRDGTPTFSTYVTFTTANGHSEFALLPVTLSNKYHEGEKLTVMYDPSSPHRIADAGNPVTPFLIPGIAFLFGVFWLVVGIIFVRKAAKSTQTMAQDSFPIAGNVDQEPPTAQKSTKSTSGIRPAHTNDEQYLD